MAEWEQLDAQLKDLGQATTDRVREPLPAADVRALGVRRRHHRHAAMIAVATVLVVLSGAGVYAVGAQPQQREPGPAAPVTVSSTPAASDPTPSELLGHGKKLKKKSTEPTGRDQSQPTYQPTVAPRSATPSSSQTPESPDPSTSEPEPSETSVPEPTDTEEPAPDRSQGPAPTSVPTNSGGQRPAPEPTDGSSGQ